MPTVTVLSCPVCAAPLRPESPRCDYCGSVVVIQTDHPRLDPSLLNKAVVDEHIARFRAAVRRDPNDETAHYGLGVAYFNLGLLEESVDELAQAARLMPENPHIQLQLAVVYADLANRGVADAEQSARDRVDRALLLQPNLVEGLLLKADLHLRRRQWNQALVIWRQAMAIDADSVRIPIAKFLADHEPVLLKSAQYSGDAAREERRAAIAIPRSLSDLAAVGVFLLSCVLLFVTSGKSSWLPSVLLLTALIGPVVVFVYGLRRWRPAPPDLVASWNAVDAERRKLLEGHTAEPEALLEAAEYVVTDLERSK